MLILICSIFLITCFLIVFILILRSPKGYQDHEGFHNLTTHKGHSNPTIKNECPLLSERIILSENLKLVDLNKADLNKVEYVKPSLKKIIGIVLTKKEIKNSIYEFGSLDEIAYQVYPVIELTKTGVIVFNDKGQFEMDISDIDSEPQAALDKYFKLGKRFLNEEKFNNLISFINQNIKNITADDIQNMLTTVQQGLKK